MIEALPRISLRRLFLSYFPRTVLESCRHASTSREFASLLVRQVAMATGSEFCIWIEWDNQAARLISFYSAASADSSRAFVLCAQVAASGAGQCSGQFAAAPLKIRSQVCGVLAVGNRLTGSDPDDLLRLEELGQAAWLRWDYLRRCEALGVESPAGDATALADLAHELRQPLSAIEALASFLEIILPANEARAREHLQEIRLQVTTADRILTSRIAADTSLAQPVFEDRKAAAEAANFAFTHDTIASVTH
jgi:signal transduction histidine kinase